ncbi:hypothetical protein Tco_1089460, partial [Tanacetum coccineum]
MASVQGQFVVQATTTATPAIQNATNEVPPFSSSHSISSNYTSAFLNLKNHQSTEREVVSMLDINVQHEVPQFESLNAIYLRLSDLEKQVKKLKNVDHSSALLSTIKSKVLNVIKEYLGTSLDDALYKVLQKHSADIAKEHSVPAKIIKRLKQQYGPQKSTDDIQKIKMEHASKQQVPKFTITSSDTAALEEFDQKTTLINTMTNFKSFNKIPKHKALYHALMELILKDKDAIDECVADKLKKRKPDNADQDEGHTTGSHRGLKRQRTRKGTETSKKTSTSKDYSKGKSPSTFSKSSKFGKSAKDHVEEPIYVQDSDYATHDDAEFDNTDMLMDLGEDLGKTDEQPNDEDAPKYDWYKKSKSNTIGSC